MNGIMVLACKNTFLVCNIKMPGEVMHALWDKTGVKGGAQTVCVRFAGGLVVVSCCLLIF